MNIVFSMILFSYQKHSPISISTHRLHKVAIISPRHSMDQAHVLAGPESQDECAMLASLILSGDSRAAQSRIMWQM